MTSHWDIEKLSNPPKTFAAPGFGAPGVDALFFEGEPCEARQTRVFAWMGLPYLQGNAKCPAMVLLHGGRGTAFDEWVRIWNRRGYAAITFDQCGCVPEQPEPVGGPHERHEWGGPPGWDASFDQMHEEIPMQWQYHAVAAAMRAHSLIASHPAVDENRIGLTGISWGGYLTCLVAAVDKRFKCAVPVYGCGFLGENSGWKDTVEEPWLSTWDPAVFLPQVDMPCCWVSGTNDGAYPLDSLQKSYRLPEAARTLCIRIEMPHGHEPGWAPTEIGTFADSVLSGGPPLARITGCQISDGIVEVSYKAVRPIVNAELCYTRATGFWSDRKYNSVPIDVEHDSGRLVADVPASATVLFINLYDDRGCVVSTEHVEL